MRVLTSSVLALAALASSMTTLTAATPLGSLQPEAVFVPQTLAQAGSSTSGRGLLQRRGDSIGTRSIAELFGLTRTRRSGASSQAQRKRRRTEASQKQQQGPARRAGTCSKKTTSSSSSSVAPSSTAKAASSTKVASSTSTQAAKATTTTSSASNPAKTAGTVMAGYWPSWANGELPPDKIDWTKFDIMNFAFATPNKDGTLNLGDWEAGLLKKLVTAGHKGNAKVVLSVGGWGGSGGFSPSVASDSMRAKFVKSLRSAYDTYNLDGIDLDWEYPNSQAAGTYSGSDTSNFQTFLTSLRAGLPSGALITAAVPQSPWLASNGSPVGSVARAAAAMDYIMIMNYDVWGASSTPGPNAPLADLCGNSTQPSASAAAAVKQWSAASMPRSKMLLGSPLYGYLSTSGKTTLKQREVMQSSNSPLYTAMTGRANAQVKRDLSQADGQINFNDLVSGGVLSWSGNEYVAAGGYTKYWDDCSDTPYLANGKKVVSYDDTDSLFDKGSFALKAGLGGSSVWSVDGDVSSWRLTTALRSGMGLS